MRYAARHMVSLKYRSIEERPKAEDVDETFN